MTYGFHELTVGGVLFAPFVLQAAIAFALFLASRPLLRIAQLDRFFANPPLIGTCLYVLILAAIMLIS